MFGVITTEYAPSRGFFQVVPNRQRRTLLPILDTCLLPNSTLHSDDYASYTNLRQLLPNKIAVHRVVNHSLNFVDPVTGVHTQTMESAWNVLKLPVKAKKGVAFEDLQFYLDDRMWRQWKGQDDVFTNFLVTLSLQYPNRPAY